MNEEKNNIKGNIQIGGRLGADMKYRYTYRNRFCLLHYGLSSNLASRRELHYKLVLYTKLNLPPQICKHKVCICLKHIEKDIIF